MDDEIPVITLGQVARLFADFVRLDNTLVDPDSITVYVTSPAGVTTSSTDVVRDDEGKYHYDYTPAAAGTWSYRWASEGEGKAAQRGSFIVLP